MEKISEELFQQNQQLIHELSLIIFDPDQAKQLNYHLEVVSTFSAWLARDDYSKAMQEADQNRHIIQANRHDLLLTISDDLIYYDMNGECFQFESKQELSTYIHTLLEEDRKAYFFNLAQEMIIEITEEYTDIFYLKDLSYLNELINLAEYFDLYSFEHY
ncbi:MAG: hypothetical protein MK212_17625 [Saprospiraceae bacterium]|nr:hypothetical protein [Saprospiraceae bacterium]